ncbi:glycosyltransferase [Dermabacter vaginalis]|uniref:glycosyltransferase n=1 Tax=Dermabacter vaginalis TaxID=1630135 RepID=UPI0021A27718|nr:glycosyltransferase [Dermabacter vaginalis]MCT2149482.1 glycosyltransferase [Dermabacter vaginalis]
MSPHREPEVDTDLTVLMPLWKGDDPDHAREALASATLHQTVAPGLLLLAIDGPLPQGLEEVVSEVLDGDYGRARVVRNKRHCGLARTLDSALAHCESALVARADADDVSRPERFAVQLSALRDGDLDIVGAYMREIDERSRPRRSEDGEDLIRRRPLAHEEIARYMRDHSPFHHPTVLMRVSAVQKAGGYRDVPLMEDYDLWHRMLRSGARMGNVPDVLVEYRVSANLYRRRGGLTLFVSDVRMQFAMLKSGTTSVSRAVRNLFGRAVYRTIPAAVRDRVYWRVIERGLMR